MHKKCLSLICSIGCLSYSLYVYFLFNFIHLYLSVYVFTSLCYVFFFSPAYHCPQWPDEVYRSVASCEPTCGVTHIPGVCTEIPEEGCVCHNGLKRQGEICVPEDMCGCEVLMPNGMYWMIAVSSFPVWRYSFTNKFGRYIWKFICFPISDSWAYGESCFYH